MLRRVVRFVISYQIATIALDHLLYLIRNAFPGLGAF